MKTGRTLRALSPRRLTACAGKVWPVAATLAAGLAHPVLAQGPQGGQVVNGSATFNHQGSYTGITASNGAIINWASFNIGAGQTVQFFQPSANSRVLNRITGPDPTRIAGTLLSNGIVYIANPSGVFFAHGSLVNVGGIYAAAGTISNADFLSRTDHFTGLTGVVENRGVINASQNVDLIGSRVANYGTVNVPHGAVTMVAGDDVYIGQENGHFFARVSAAADPGAAGVTQAGEIHAAGGTVNMAAADVYALAIDHPGTTVAHDITLQGGRQGTVQVSGVLDASAHEPGGVGGTVEVLGDKVGLFGGRIDVSGDAGGGTVLFGGNRQGGGTEMTATATYISPDATINADALHFGNGGRVIIWSNVFTNYQGHISARGGSDGGDGGFVETSGKQHLRSWGSVTASAARGRAGLWLLDPTDITISTSPTSNGNLTGGVFNLTANPNTANLDILELTTALNGGTSVQISTNSTGSGPNAGSITLNADLLVSTAAGATLTLTADSFIQINNAITSTGDALNLNFQAGTDITIAHAISLNGGSFTLTAGGNVAVNAAVSTAGGLFSSSGVDFASTAGGTISTAGGAFTVNHTGNVTIGDTVTAGAGSVDVTGGGATGITLAADVSGSGDQTYHNNVTLATDVTLTSAGLVWFEGTVDGTSAGQQFLRIARPAGVGGNGRFDMAVGGGVALQDLSVAGATLIKSDITTAGDQTYSGAVTLGGNVTATSTANGAITFAGAVDADLAANNRTLTVNTGGVTALAGAVGAAQALLSLTTDDQSAIGEQTRLGANVTTTGDQAFHDAAVLTGNSTLSGNNIRFFSTVDSNGVAHNLTVNSSGGGTTRFDGAIGQASALGALRTDAVTADGTSVVNGTITAASVDFGDALALNGGAVTTTGNQTYRGATTVGADTTLSSQGLVRFQGTVDALSAGSQFLHVTRAGGVGANAQFDLAVGGSAALHDVSVLGSTTLLADVTTTGGQVYVGAVTLGANITATSIGAGAITFSATVDADAAANNRTLTINTAGVTTLGGAVGSAQSLLSLTTDDQAGVGEQTRLGGNVTTGGNQSYQDALVLTGNATLAGHDVRFFKAVNSDGTARNLTVNSSGGGTTRFDAAVGQTSALGTLRTDAVTADGTTILGAAVTAGFVDVGDALTLNGGTITTAGGNQTYRGAVTLGADTTLAGASLFFLGAVNSDATARALIVNGSTGASFSSAVGNTSALASLTTNLGTVSLRSVTTVGAQAYNNGTVTLSGTYTGSGFNIATGAAVLGGDSTIAAGAGGIHFGGTVNGGFALHANSAAATAFDGAIGAGSALAALVTDAGGGTTLGGGVLNSGVVSFGDALTLGASTVVTAPTSATFLSTVDSAAGQGFNLLINSAAARFAGDVGLGAGGVLGTLLTGAGGTTTIDAAQISAGTLTFNSAVVLGTASTLTGSSAVTFAAALDSQAGENNDLTVNSPSTRFAGPVGATGALGALTTDAAGSTVIDAASMNGGTITFHDAVVLGTTSTLAAGSVSFGSTLDSQAGEGNGLTVNATTTTFAGSIGGIDRLGALDTDAAGTTTVLGAVRAASVVFRDTLALDGGLVDTTGAQTYQGAVTLGADTTMNGAALTLMGTVDSGFVARDLTLNSPGTTTIAGAMGGVSPLGAVLTDLPGTTLVNGAVHAASFRSLGSATFNGGSVTTTGAQRYDAVVRLGADTTLTGGSLRFGGGVTSLGTARDLTVTSAGLVEFNGAVGGAVGFAIRNLSIQGAGTTSIAGGSVTTTGDQEYHQTVQLVGDAALSGQNVRFHSGVGSVGGTGNLVVNAPGQTLFSGTNNANPSLASLTTDTGGTTSITGTMRTSGAQSYGDVVTLNGGAIRSTGSTVEFKDQLLVGGNSSIFGGRGVRFRGAVDGAAAGANLLVDIDATGNTGLADAWVIRFDGNVGASTALGSLTLGDDAANPRGSTPALVPTIVTGLSDMTFHTTGGFAMGRNQKLAAAGNVSVLAGGDATLGDMSSGGLLTVHATNIFVNLRAAGEVLGSNGTKGNDAGVDFVAKTGIDFSVAPVASAATAGLGYNAPSFATPGVSGMSATLDASIRRNYSGDPAGQVMVGGNFYDLRSEGPTTANVAEAIAGAVPRETQSGEVPQGAGVRKAQLDLLNQIGVYPKDVKLEQLVDFLSGRALYNDVPAKTTLEASDYKVTVYRLNPDTVDRVLDDYSAVYNRTFTDATTGKTSQRADPDYVNQVLGDAWAQYSPEGDKPPEGFREFLRADPARAEALRYLDGLRKLLVDLELLGLNRAETESARRTVLSTIRLSSDLDSNKTRAAIIGRPVPGSAN